MVAFVGVVGCSGKENLDAAVCNFISSAPRLFLRPHLQPASGHRRGPSRTALGGMDRPGAEWRLSGIDREEADARSSSVALLSSTLNGGSSARQPERRVG